MLGAFLIQVSGQLSNVLGSLGALLNGVL